jgi:hypothetical protein
MRFKDWNVQVIFKEPMAPSVMLRRHYKTMIYTGMKTPNVWLKKK